MYIFPLNYQGGPIAVHHMHWSKACLLVCAPILRTAVVLAAVEHMCMVFSQLQKHKGTGVAQRHTYVGLQPTDSKSSCFRKLSRSCFPNEA